MIGLYRLLALLLPRRVRERHLEALVRTFTTRLESARASGGLGATIVVATREYLDLLASAVRERGGADPLHVTEDPMPRSPFIRRSVAAVAADTRFALRLLVRQPGFTAAAVLTLALGIGANVAVFSVVWNVLLAPAPYRHAHELVVASMTGATTQRGSLSPLDARDLATRSRTIATLAISQRSTRNLTGVGDPQRIEGQNVSANFFDVLGLAPAMGRWITPAEVASDASVVVLSDTLWRQQFGADPDVVGRSITLNNEPVEVVGVMPEDAAYPDDSAFWAPMYLGADEYEPNQRGAHFLRTVGRLRPGVTIEEARAEVAGIGTALAGEYPNTNRDSSMTVVGMRESQVEDVRPALVALSAGVALVLLVACSNLANLMLTRGLARSGEVAVRASLGASRARLATQLIVEGLVLSALGGVVSILFATWGIRSILLLVPEGLPRMEHVGIDLPVLAFLAGLSLLAGLIFGLLPAWRASRANVAALTREGGTRSVTGGRGLRRGLAVAEVALAVTLLGTAGLLGRTIAELSQIDPGFNTERALTYNVTLPSPPYEGAARRQMVMEQIVERLESSPGVTAATIGFGIPFGSYNSYTSFNIEGIETPPDSDLMASLRVVGNDYFQTMGMPLRGRGFGPEDQADGPLVAVISQATASRYFGEADPIGRSLRVHVAMTNDAPRGYRTVVGVVNDVRMRSLTDEMSPEIYMPYSQHAVGSATVVVRTQGDPMAAVPVVRRAMRDVDANLPMSSVRSLETLVARSAARQRLTAALLGIFAAIAVVLAAVGLYGVFSIGVSQRTREIGIRMALGADRGRVLSMFVREGFGLTLAGAAIGIAGALAASTLVESLLVGVSPRDPLTLAAASLLLVVVSVTACYLPARRAARVNAVSVLLT